MICYFCGTRISNNNNSSIIYVCSDYCYHIALKFHRINKSNLLISSKVCSNCNLDISGFNYCHYYKDSLYCSDECAKKLKKLGSPDP